MNPIKRYVTLFLLAAALRAQDGILSVSDPSWRGLEIGFVTKIEPDGTRLSGGVTMDGGRVHHVITDDAHKRYFGYDLALDVMGDGKTAQLRIEPLLELPAWMSRSILEGNWIFYPLPKHPAVPNLHVGDTVTLDLLMNESTGQKVVDYLTLRRRGDMDVKREARDFSLSDVEMSMLQPRIWVNGKLDPDKELGGAVGAVLWINLAGHGRYILSLLPQENLGFKRSGVVSQYGLTFRDGTTEVHIECGSRVAPGSGNYNLYVLHEASAGGWGRFGSADRAESALKKH